MKSNCQQVYLNIPQIKEKKKMMIVISFFGETRKQFETDTYCILKQKIGLYYGFSKKKVNQIIVTFSFCYKWPKKTVFQFHLTSHKMVKFIQTVWTQSHKGDNEEQR